jgi:hypothetical protein
MVCVNIQYENLYIYIYIYIYIYTRFQALVHYAKTWYKWLKDLWLTMPIFSHVVKHEIIFA